ncbi:hypothetical protein [Desulfonatronum thioautotrophicum]|uniref:hypothetical protein n=1 Tax=Desulfonatronum thioautotrophicum TaxID=617001 RepID=UPI0005EB071A|nr:hypothetical protein [Desulfonatronum thioautotrophicum]
MELTSPLLDLATERCRANAGAMLNGIVHNLNNPVHALAMQTELLQNTLRKDGLDARRSTIQEKCSRLQRIGEELKAQLETLAWRDTYVSPSRQLIDSVHFGSWLLQFWQSNLLFKHCVSPALVTEPAPPHLQAIPLALTWCLEEPLKALLQFNPPQGSQDTIDLVFVLGPASDSGLMALMTATCSSAQPMVEFGEIDHAREIHELTALLGWEWEAVVKPGDLKIRLAIPG